MTNHEPVRRESLTMLPSGFHELLFASAAIRREVEFGGYVTYQPFVPSTECTEAGLADGLEDGWSLNAKRVGTCPVCHMVPSLSGACECGVGR